MWRTGGEEWGAEYSRARDWAQQRGILRGPADSHTRTHTHLDRMWDKHESIRNTNIKTYWKGKRCKKGEKSVNENIQKEME